MIVVEDDLLFSPDFLDFFHANAPLLDMDPTTFVIRYHHHQGGQAGRQAAKAREPGPLKTDCLWLCVCVGG